MTALERFVDTHVHLWDLAQSNLNWNWIDTPDDHPILGNIDQIKMRAFTMRALEAETKGLDVEAFVHVQAAIGSVDPVEETRWLEQMAGQHPRLAAIIGHVDLQLPTTGDVIDAHREASPRFRGVRDFAVEPWLASGEENAGMEAGLAQLQERSLVLDLDCEYPNMVAARRMAERHEGLTIVLEHLGFPRRRDDDYFTAWAAGMRELASAPNVVCKISGIAMTDPDFTLESLRRWMLTCIEAFGPNRCMIGSNWPLDRLFSSYPTIIEAYQLMMAELAPAERTAVLRETARLVYALDE